MFLAGVMTKKGIFLSVDPFKEKTNQHQTLYLDPQRAGFMGKPNIIKGWLSEIV